MPLGPHFRQCDHASRYHQNGLQHTDLYNPIRVLSGYPPPPTPIPQVPPPHTSGLRPSLPLLPHPNATWLQASVPWQSSHIMTPNEYLHQPGGG